MPRLSILVLALISTILVTPAGTTQTSKRERQMHVSVIDQGGAAVIGLGPSDFIVREDGIRREVVSAEPATAPMQIAILIDTSVAAAKAIQVIRVAVLDFIQQMHEKNEITLITFGDRPTILVESTSDFDKLKKGLNRTFSRPDTGSYFLDTLYNTTRGFLRRRANRPVILVITAEGVEFSNHNRDRVLKSLHSSGAALHTIVLGSGTGVSAGRAERDRSIVLSEGSKTTGGRRDTLRTNSALKAKLKQVADELSNQYLIGYVRPQTLIPPKATAVQVKNPTLVARGNPVIKNDENLPPKRHILRGAANP